MKIVIFLVVLSLSKSYQVIRLINPPETSLEEGSKTLRKLLSNEDLFVGICHSESSTSAEIITKIIQPSKSNPNFLIFSSKFNTEIGLHRSRPMDLFFILDNSSNAEVNFDLLFFMNCLTKLSPILVFFNFSTSSADS